MISKAFPELLRLQVAAIDAVDRACRGGGTLALCTSIESIRREALQARSELHVANTVAARAGVEVAKVHAVTAPAIDALRALADECDRELDAEQRRQEVA